MMMRDLVEPLRDFLYTSFFKGVTIDYSEFTDTAKVAKESSELSIRRHRSTGKTAQSQDPTQTDECQVVVSVIEP